MKFTLGNETEISLNWKEMLVAVGLSVVAFGGLAVFKALLMMI